VDERQVIRMAYENVGAFVDGKRPSSKAALKAALRGAPETVTFDSTSMLVGSRTFTPDTIPAGVILSVVGPDPYTSRKFYASVTSGPKGVRLT